MEHPKPVRPKNLESFAMATVVHRYPLQGHIHRVTHSFKHVSPWVSLLLILSGDTSINPGPNTGLLTGSLINIRSIRNKSVAFADFTIATSLMSLRSLRPGFDQMTLTAL